MITPFSENDYEINIKDYLTGEWLSLGSGDYCSVKFDGVGSPELGEAVFDVSGGDGVHFGIERLRGVNWTITGAIHSGSNKNVQGSADSVWNLWSAVSRAWTAYPERKKPRAVVPLYFKRPGREQMVVFGRPRRIDPETDRSHSGFISYTALYTQSDPRFYSAAESSTVITLAVPIVGGILLNKSTEVGNPSNPGGMYTPFRTSTVVPRGSGINNRGDSPSNPVIAITGPVLNPTVTYFSQAQRVWTVKLAMTVAAGETVTIDTRHWARFITNQSGASRAGYYRGDKLEDILIYPGEGYFEYSGVDITGTSTCKINFRNAWVST